MLIKIVGVRIKFHAPLACGPSESKFESQFQSQFRIQSKNKKCTKCMTIKRVPASKERRDNP